MANFRTKKLFELMNIRQQIVGKLTSNGIDVSGNQLEVLIYEYKKKYSNKFKGIDLMFDMLDEEDEFFKFLKFVNETKGCEAEEHFTIITCFACNCQCEKKEQGLRPCSKT